MTLKYIIPEHSGEGKSQEWLGLAIDEGTWEHNIDAYFLKLKKIK